MFEIKRAEFPHDLDIVLDIYREYISSTSVELDFQDNEEEFAQLPEKYSSSESQIFIALNGQRLVGCAAFREIDAGTCEMKRVYVRPEARGHKLGSRLVEQVLDSAAEAGYLKICLDVLPEFKAALALYKSYGFREHNPITFNPVPGTEFLGLSLETYSKANR